MTQQTCEACGQPLLRPLRLLKCDKCGVDLINEGGRYAKVNGICTPFCFGCAPMAETGDNALEQSNGNEPR